MTTDEIVRMAREAGFVIDEKAQQHQPNCVFHTHHMIDEPLKRFAALVAAKETERLREAARMALEALEQWDGLIKHQYTGSAAAMTDMHYAAQATVPVLEALREALGENQ